ncbi:MAG TPA: FIST N-terminal domain-containing protein [Steroidobacteraceae bacterium]|nr:FIST N-terminal domain-containing protein [Steroidobacteraceae bacterium]
MTTPVAQGDAPIVRFRSAAPVAAAAEAIAAGAAGSALTVLFASGDYALGELGAALAARGLAHVIGAATGRIIGAGGVERHGISGFHLPAGRFAAAETVFEDVAAWTLPQLRERVRALRAELDARAAGELANHFALLLVDAETRCEERLAAMLGMELSGVALVGGSAGDLYFNPLGRGVDAPPLLYHGGAVRNAALLALVATSAPLAAYCHNHYTTTERKVVITGADPLRRIVDEIDGMPALKTYAALCGLRRNTVSAEDFAPFPLMVRIGGQYYARGVQRIANGSALEFACAIERGLVVTLARPGDMVERLKELFGEMRARIGTPELVIGFDCAARAAYMERQGLTGRIAPLLAAHSVSGFATLGEQYNTVHANNSFTCLGLGAP